MRNKLPLIIFVAIFAVLFGTGILNWNKTVGWLRHAFFRAKGAASEIGKPGPTGDLNKARICRDNLKRIQAAKRKAAQDRGQQVGEITWGEILHAMPNVPPGKLTPAQIQKYMPTCPSGGTYTQGTLEQVPRCTVSGQNTLTLEDDHIILD
jgi:hypothetical protein